MIFPALRGTGVLKKYALPGKGATFEMKIYVTVRKESGEVVEERYYHCLTEKQWRKQFYKPKKSASPIHLEWWISPKRMSTADYYDADDVNLMSDREIEKIRMAEAEARYEKRQQKKWDANHPWWDEAHTAWQWLSQYGRIPAPGKNAFPREHYTRGWLTDEDIWVPGKYDRTWWYYNGSDTVPIPDGLKEKLRKMYIIKYGGWGKIDLDNTDYDGHAWWTEADLRGFKLPKPEIKKWPRYKPRKRKTVKR